MATFRSALLLALAVLLTPGVRAQQLGPAVEGRITSGGEAVPLATVRVAGTALATVADVEGRFRLVLPGPGTHALVFSAVGYVSLQREVTAADGQTVRIDIELAEETYDAGAFVVTGTMQQIGVRESPVKVDVLPSRFLETIPSTNMMDAIERVNGLYQQIDCGVCYTNNIRINGMEGPYTAVLIDGMPIMSSLATVYGLNGISPMLIRQVEVVKGPMSTLYGSEALGGVINILTKDPATAPRLSVNAFTTTHEEVAAEFAVVPLRGRTSALVSSTLFWLDRYHDNNGDGFSDRPSTRQLAVFGKVTRSDRHGFAQASLTGKLYYEDRAGGPEPYFRNPGRMRGSATVYGESIYTRRAELLGTWRLRPDLQLQAAGSVHGQDSFYGYAAYDARQADAFAQAVYTPVTEGTPLDGHGLLAGAALRALRYDDGSAATGRYDEGGALVENWPDERLVPGVFIQDDWEATDRLRLLGGFRADWQPGYGLIPSPSAALKWSPSDLATARLNVGTGFRIVNLFTEDHAAYTGGRATVILEDLRPERSVSTTAGFQQIVHGLGDPITMDFDVFWTRFSNKIEPSYYVPGEIRYRNLKGSSTTRGAALQVQGTAPSGLSYTAGATVMDVYVEEAGVRRALEFAPRFQGTATVTWEAPLGLGLDYTARLTGPMALPAYSPEVRAGYEAATGSPLRARSPTYTVHNVQVTKDVLLAGGRLIQAYLAVENALDFRQSSPLVGYYDGVPGFGESFDTAYVYGPIEGRHFGFGVRLTIP